MLRAGIIYVHWWAGRMLKDDYAGTAEDAINTILKVRIAFLCLPL